MSTAVVFPGQGSHRPGMASVWDEHPAGVTFDEVGRACGLPALRRLADDPSACRATAVGQPAVFAASLAAWRALTAAGVEPTHVAGHSLGELTAATAIGALSVADGAALVGERGRAFDAACRRHDGGMVAVVGAGAGEIGPLIAEIDGVIVANDNAEGQVVLAGPVAALEQAVERCRQAGVRTRSLDVQGAFHTAAMTPALVRFGAALRRVTVSSPAVPIVRGLDATVVRSSREVARGLLDGILGRVRWREVQLCLADEGVRTMVEAGPSGVLRGLARRSRPSFRVYAVDGPGSLLGLQTELAAVTR